ncbi:MAG: hypothetical protein LBK82_06090 [Planctomycetaceae bacterium]|nr:hypothetical protein [Planctomycetaceae bacterium]
MRIFVSLFLCLFLSTLSVFATDNLKKEFAKPDAENRPWVYWFWNNGNLTKEGITADLEAMANTGIGGVLIMEVGQNAPAGPVDFLSDQWRELFQFMIKEAKRCGIEVNMNNDAGWNGSGGKWIKPEHGMQVLTWSETNLTEPKPEKIILPEPPKKLNYYNDIAVFAFPTPTDNAEKKHVDPNSNHRATPANKVIVAQKDVLDLTEKMAADGTLDWKVPAGNWTVLRIGHTCKGIVVHPAPTSGVGLECDKLSIEASEDAFNGQMGKLIADNKEFAGIGKTLMSTHIDSWENGSQNWTPKMRNEFQQRRNYDLWKFVPVFAGYIIDSTEITDRFLWDFRRTVSEMCLDNHVAVFKRLANQHGLKLSIEAYGSPCDHIQYGGMADEPMGEFWIGGGAISSCRGMASAGHIYGRKIIGAEAFTADNSERWQQHPGSMKALGDTAFCEGINRFVFHRYSFQPWVDVKPGLMMGPWGVHYERTQTWWHLTPAWHEYLSRCQFMLRQGDFVADIVYVETEDSPQHFPNHYRSSFSWDQCGADAVYLMSVKNGKLTLPSGASYEILVLPNSSNMTPELLKKVTELVKDGATIIGKKPVSALGLTSYPENDKELAVLAEELWGKVNESVGERNYGNGKVIWGKLPETVLTEKGIRPDFLANRRLNQIHRRTADADFYFVANPSPKNILTQIVCRVTGKPELWYPESGKTVPAPIYRAENDSDNGTTTLLLPMEPSQSVFVVFPHRNKQDKNDSVVALSYNGTVIEDLTVPFTTIEVERAVYGILDDPNATRDATTAVKKLITDGLKEISVSKITQAVGDPKHGVVKTLRIEFTSGGKPYSVSATDGETVFLNVNVPKIKILNAKYGPLNDETKTIDVQKLLQKILDAGENDFSVARLARNFDPAPMVVKTLNFEYELNGKTQTWSGKDHQSIFIGNDFDNELLPIGINEEGLAFRNNGHYELQTASGKKIGKNVVIREPLEISGSWTVRFPIKKTIKETTFDQLISWSDSSDDAIKYFSGTAIYRTTFNVPKDFMAQEQRVILDLGQVNEIATVKVNGKELGILWTLTKAIDVTEALQLSGENVLEIHVTNLWCNRLIGDAKLPQDKERQPNGTLSAWPEWLTKGQPDPHGRETFSMWNLWKPDDTLQPSGLIGPVQLKVVSCYK